MIFRKARRASRADSGGRTRSRTPLSPSPPLSRGRSPSPLSGPMSRRRSPSPRGGSYRHHPRSPSPPSTRPGRDLPPSVPTGPRGFRPITAQQPPSAPDGPAIPTGPRSRFPQQPPRGPAALNKPGGAGGLPAIPTGPKAWRTGLLAPQGPAGVPTGPSALRQREPSPPPRREQQKARRRSAESPVSTPPPRQPAAREPSPPPASTSAPAPAPHVVQVAHAKPVAPTPPPPPAPLSPAPTASLAADREARLTQIDAQRRSRILAKFLPRSAGGLATIQPLAKAAVAGPVGAEWEAEVSDLACRSRSSCVTGFSAWLKATRCRFLKVPSADTSSIFFRRSSVTAPPGSPFCPRTPKPLPPRTSPTTRSSRRSRRPRSRARCASLRAARSSLCLRMRARWLREAGRLGGCRISPRLYVLASLLVVVQRLHGGSRRFREKEVVETCRYSSRDSLPLLHSSVSYL